ncbi:MAG: acyl-CoA thioesterase [Holophagales bacterium]|jgi:acyl-CoA thioester hydrolase|nr:acyl-CoA thioesterase [Holophagales bacterium]MBK9964707.1 acyl-CoA thioesterase [Holophagales bacterium]
MRDVRLPEFPCVVGVEVRFRDLDAMGHVNNAVYLSYFEQARLAFWLALHPAFSPGEAIDPAQFGFVLARAECDYASPVRLGERLLVGCRAGDFGTSSFAFDYRIVAAGGSVDAEMRLVASGRTVQVTWDWASGTKVPLSDDLKKRIEAFQASTPRAHQRPAHPATGS